MIRILIVFIMIALAPYCHGQGVSVTGDTYPEGIYLTKEDFLRKTPTGSGELVPKSISMAPRKVIDTVPDQCLFYYKDSDKKIKKAFAVSYRGNLYFQALSVLKNRDKKDRSETSNSPISFCRVLIAGENYLYMELPLANSWKQGLGHGLGGVAGSMIASNAIKGKGVVWDFKKGEFNIFRSCRDYNEFIADRYPEGVQECTDKQPDLLQVRAAMEKIR